MSAHCDILSYLVCAVIDDRIDSCQQQAVQNTDGLAQEWLLRTSTDPTRVLSSNFGENNDNLEDLAESHTLGTLLYFIRRVLCVGTYVDATKFMLH